MVKEEVIVKEQVPVIVEKEVVVEKQIVVEKEVAKEVVVEKIVVQTVVSERIVTKIQKVDVVRDVSTGPYGGDLTVISQSSIKSLDSDFSGAYVARAVAVHMWEYLFAMDETFTPQPLMIDTWSLSSDNLTYTYTLREGLKYHDGKAVTAEDAVLSIQKWQTKAPAAKLLLKFTAEDGLKAVGDRTFTLTLSDSYCIIGHHAKGCKAHLEHRCCL